MASEETSSISKGCFLFNAKADKNDHGTKSKKRRNRPARTTKKLFSGYKFPALPGENDDQTALRYKNFEECWTNISQQIETIQIDTNKKVFEDLLEFIQKSHNRFGMNSAKREIPTAALLTGVNMPDHEVIFHQITTNISENISPHVVLLHSKDCSNLKHLLKELLTQLMISNEEMDESAVDLDKSCIEDMGKLKHYTLSVLKSWYSRQSTTSSDNPPIVIILEDFEGFNQLTLQDFILIASEYIDQLPIILIFSLATTLAAVHRSLPHSVSTRLSIEKFQAEPSLECLHEILDKVFLTSTHPFKLGPRMSNLLFDKFLCQDFSIQNFANAVQFSLLEHFYSNPLSILCTNDKSLLASSIEGFSQEHLDYVRGSSSFQRFADRKSLAEQKKLQKDENYLKETVAHQLEDLRSLQSTLFPMLRCLHVLTTKVPGSPFGRRLKDVYEFVLEQDLASTDVYKNTIKLLKHSSRDDLLAALKSCRRILKDSAKTDSYCESFTKPLKQMKKFIKRFTELDAEQHTQPDTAEMTVATKMPAKMPVYKNRFEFQERMRQAMKEKKATPFDNLRGDVIDFWDAVFREFLRCPMKLPLHEIIFYDDKDAVAPHINATPKLSIQTALRCPHQYLKCKCCQIDADDNRDTLPDISIAYKIHLECGRMINIYDWLQAYAEVADPTPSSRKSSKKRQAEDGKLQARFIQSVSELQLLGFIKPTKRKTDHVQRLTWGY